MTTVNIEELGVPPQARNKLVSEGDLLLIIDRIDQKINSLLNAIIHHPRFQKLESAWRGLNLVSRYASTGSNIELKLFPISYLEASKDLTRAADFDSSVLFQKIYTDAFDSPGGKPVGIIIADFAISHLPQTGGVLDGVSFLSEMAKIAAASHAPFITGVKSELFGLSSFAEVNSYLDFEQIFSQDEYARFRNFRASEDARFIGLVLPSVLMRLPYGQSHRSLQNLGFKEVITSRDDYCWGNGVYVYAASMLQEFAENDWFSSVHQLRLFETNNFYSAPLNPCYWQTDHGEIFTKPMLELVITDSQQQQLSDVGFIPICEQNFDQSLGFYNCRSVQMPKQYNDHQSNANAVVSAMLFYVLSASRFAHYVKVIARDLIGRFMSAGDCQSYLNEWIRSYCLERASTTELRASHPLREAKIEVKEKQGMPGKYYCVMKLIPHCQLDEIKPQLKLVSNIVV